MKYLSEKEFNAKMKRIKAENLTKKRKAQLKEKSKKIGQTDSLTTCDSNRQ